MISNAVSDSDQVAKDNSDGLKDGENLVDISTRPGRLENVASPGNGISSTLEAELMQLKDAINSLRRFLGKIRLNLERKADHVTLFEMVSAEEWVYEKKFGYLKAGRQGAEVSG